MPTVHERPLDPPDLLSPTQPLARGRPCPKPVSYSEQNGGDAAAALLALGPGVVDAFLYEEAETV